MIFFLLFIGRGALEQGSLLKFLIIKLDQIKKR